MLALNQNRDDVCFKFLQTLKVGSWLAVTEDGYELLGYGDTPEEARAQAQKSGYQDPVLVPPDWQPRILHHE